MKNGRLLSSSFSIGLCFRIPLLFWRVGWQAAAGRGLPALPIWCAKVKFISNSIYACLTKNQQNSL